MATAAALRDQGHRNVITYSRKVFIPLTHLCRDVCHYCTFAQPPRKGEQVFMTPEQVLEVARQGAAMGCKEALFTLGDKPELRYKAAREALAALGHETTLSYLAAMARLVHEETGLFPHLNPGLMTDDDLAMLRPLAPSMGIMLESTAASLLEKGKPHHGSPDKEPEIRLEALRRAGRAQVPFTSGILIGIGESREERIESLLALRDIQDEFGNIQEIIVQNFRAKPGTRMAEAPEPDLDELLWTLAGSRILFGPVMNIQVPPNLSPGQLRPLVAAGINDWGGVSPLTPDFVNPEAPWPHLDKLAAETAATGKLLVERLTIYPEYALDPERWLDPAMRTPVIRAIDGEGYPRTEDWSPGEVTEPPASDMALLAAPAPARLDPWLSAILRRAENGERLDLPDVARLFLARGDEFTAVCRAADELRREVCGDTVSYVVNRNINYTNVCYFKCQFCAFSKGKLTENLRGQPYVLGMDEIQRRTSEAWSRGATEVCMQGGIHPSYTGQTYIDITRAVKEAVPDMHVHAFSPLEVWQGAETLGISLREFLVRLREAGLGTLPGTAGEVLDDEVRRVLCPDKINTAQWFEVMETAHGLGIRTTSTIMYGHVDGPVNWARHLLGLRDLQARTGGFTEFVPLPFVHMEAPIYLKGRARKGPTFREAVLMHAVARLALHPLIPNIQTSWVKMGPEGVAACLAAGVNDLGGTLMNETITRSAGASHGQEMEPYRMEEIIRQHGRAPRQRSTAYGEVSEERIRQSYQAAPLEDLRLTPAKEYERT
ncbi:MAG: 7,8-didemethyl-8-hydroxy-5-deazariboflavin synthase subunit CofH [Alphaproteobacteria bacterium]|nr:7,8-didemethyl-8-hydroxy-5-deazariboflavin synthase subunit CofH [Alphaproteobacteria bacterium]